MTCWQTIVESAHESLASVERDGMRLTKRNKKLLVWLEKKMQRKTVRELLTLVN